MARLLAPGPGSGVQSTCSMRGAPVASITSRSKPSALPRACGMSGERGQEVLVDRIALAVEALLLGHLGLEAAALLGRVGQLAEAVGELDAADIELEALGHARDRRGFGRASAASARGYSSENVARPMPSCGSICSTSTRLKMSDQLSSSATRMPGGAGLRGQRIAVGSRSARSACSVASRSMPA